MFLGINSSGKSNLFKAFQLLQVAIAGEGMEKLIQEEWLGMDNIVNKKETQSYKNFTIKYKFTYETGESNYTISIKKTSSTYQIYENLLISKTTAETKKNYDSLYFERHPNNGYYNYIEDNFNHPKTEFLVNENNESFLKHHVFILLNVHFKILLYNYFNTSFQSPIRQAAAPNSSKYLSQTGENLVHILNYLQHNQAQAYEMLLERMLEINPHFKDIAFLVYGARVAFALREKGLNSIILAEHISNGTLQYILLLSIFCNPDSPKIICIDEPETGLHPDMIQAIAELIKYAARTYHKQIFVVTHSPLLLNAFELEDAFFFEKDKDNNTIVRQHQEEDFEEDIQHLTLGQLWLTGKLGGTRY